MRIKRIPTLLDEKVDPMFDLATCLNPLTTVIELGSQWGWWARRAAKAMPDDVTIWCVDTWADDEESSRLWGNGTSNFESWRWNVREFINWKVKSLVMKSSLASRLFRSHEIDFIFVDASHKEEDVRDDLALWWPKLRSGGLIVGHDWDGVARKGVRAAVRSFFDSINRDFEIDDLYWAWRGKMLSKCWFSYK